MTYTDMIELWPKPSVKLFADDVIDEWERLGDGEEFLSINTVRSWKLRDSIPKDYFAAVVAAARRRGLGKAVTHEALCAAARESKARRRENRAAA